jgi:hypothetical protein
MAVDAGIGQRVRGADVLYAAVGAIIAGSGGLRKIRWRLSGRGKRGGIRIIYYWKGASGRLHLLRLYLKNVTSDLSQHELLMLGADLDHD